MFFFLWKKAVTPLEVTLRLPLLLVAAAVAAAAVVRVVVPVGIIGMSI